MFYFGLRESEGEMVGKDVNFRVKIKELNVFR